LVDIAKITKRSSVTNLNVRNASAWHNTVFIMLTLLETCTGWPEKVSHYQESSLNRIKNRQPG